MSESIRDVLNSRIRTATSRLVTAGSTIG